MITQESVGPGGTSPQGDSQSPSLSANGQIVAFETIASNIVGGHSGRTERRVIVRNRQSGVMMTPEGRHGEEADGGSGDPVVSGDGLAVVFTADATNLVSEPDANGAQTDVYVWRIDDGTIRRISVDGNGVQPAFGASHSASVSGDGHLVAFVSTARLVPDDTNNLADVYVRDASRGLTWLVSHGMSGRSGNGASHSPAVSADGRTIAFVSDASNLVDRDRNDSNDVYVSDLTTRSIELVSATSTGTSGNADSARPRISADGRYVVYESVASNLGSTAGCPRPVRDTNLLPDVYMFDRATRCVTRISVVPSGESWTPSIAPTIAASGTVIAYSSRRPLDECDVSTDFDLFLLTRPGGAMSAVRRSR
jgi:Tol biopolymer transport system component